MKVLLISASVGAGHRRAGEALLDAARERRDVEVDHWDVLDFVSKAYRKAYADSYIALVQRNPALWGYLYAVADRGDARRKQAAVVRMFDRLQFARFRGELRAFAPDLVLATHFLPCQVLAPYRARGRDTFPLGLVLTDLDAHALWVQPTADRFFVGSEELRAVLAGRGLEEPRVFVTGIPVGRPFRRRLPVARARESLDLPADGKVVLVMGGGHGTGAVADAVRAAADAGAAAVLAVAGRNARLEEALRSVASEVGGRVRVFGFVSDIERLMAASDLIVTKSGGLTTAECLARGLPMLVLDPTPGQEERNCDHLLEIGAAWKAHGLHSLRFKLGRLLADERRLRSMGRAARRNGRPDAARDIVASMLELAQR